jgi:ATP-binding cassette subfamily B protein
MFKLLKRFVSYYKPHKKMLILDLLAALMISITGMVYPILTNKVLDTYFPEENYKAIVIAGISILGIYVIRMLLNYFVQCY